MSTITERVIKLIAEQLTRKPEEIETGSRLIDGLGADSLDVVELTMGLEEAFGVTIPDEQAEKMLTVDDVIQFVAGSRAETA